MHYIEKSFPKLKDHISHNLSPMAMIATLHQGAPTPDAKIIFIGPCTAKKMEFQREDGHARMMDCVLTFEELQALV